MMTVYPDYYPAFRCIAEKCRHTCCAGWEIDIDEESLARYRRTEGDMGERLRRCISEGEEPHFILEEGERCPFLNGKNLCDLILYAGEEFLCQICTDHPRFRTFLPGRTEVGVGLCCEAAGALILGWDTPMTLMIEGEPEIPHEEEAYLLSLREELFAVVRDRSLPLRERMEKLLFLCGSDRDTDPMGWADFYLALERLEESWTDTLQELKAMGNSRDEEAFFRYMTGREREYENLLEYFLYRHFLAAYDDGDVAGKAAFAVLSTRMIIALGAVYFKKHGSFSFEDQKELCRRYSSEIEYSQENLDAFFDALAESF